LGRKRKDFAMVFAVFCLFASMKSHPPSFSLNLPFSSSGERGREGYEEGLGMGITSLSELTGLHHHFTSP